VTKPFILPTRDRKASWFQLQQTAESQGSKRFSIQRGLASDLVKALPTFIALQSSRSLQL
jgi:hypothetical protein